MSQNIYSPDFVKELFDKMATSYERMNYITSFGFSIRWRRQFLKQLEPSEQKMEIIDLLSGMGETWGAIKRRFPNAKLTALDFSRAMLENAHQKNAIFFNNEVVLIQEDILNNNLPSNHFDIVTCAFGLKTFNEAQLNILAQETFRILKPQGQFTFVEVSKPNNLILYVFYRFYLQYLIPILGKLLLGNPSEYRMLWRYTQQFRNAQNAANIFEKAGLKKTLSSYFFGCASGFYGVK